MAPRKHLSGFGSIDSNLNRKRKRLKNIRPFEMALVPRGANRMQFLVLKENLMKLDLTKLADVQSKIGQVITVCKSGEPAAETVDALSQDLQAAQATLSAVLGDEGSITFDAESVKTKLGALKGIADDLSENSYDLNLSDKIDNLLLGIKDVQKGLDTVKTEAKPGAVAAAATAATTAAATATAAAAAAGTTEAGKTKPEGEAGAADAESNKEANKEGTATPEGKAAEGQDGAADDGKAGAAKTADESASGKAGEAKPAAAAEADAGAASTEGAAAAAAPETKEEVVTKADLNDFAKVITEGVKSAMGELITVLKSDATQPALIPPASSTETNNGQSSEEENYWGNPFDLNAEGN